MKRKPPVRNRAAPNFTVNVAPLLRRKRGQPQVHPSLVTLLSAISAVVAEDAADISSASSSSASQDDDSMTSSTSWSSVEIAIVESETRSDGDEDEDAPSSDLQPQSRKRKRKRSKPKGVPLIPRMPPCFRGTSPVTVVLDLDETLVFARFGPVHVRPYACQLLRKCHELQCEVVVWTAGVNDYVHNILRALSKALAKDGAGVALSSSFYHHVLARSTTWCPEEGLCMKDLARLGRDVTKVVIVENNPAAVQLQPRNAIIVEDADPAIEDDQSLHIVAGVIEEACRRKEIVASLSSSESLQRHGFHLAAGDSRTGKPRNARVQVLRYTPRGNCGPRKYGGELWDAPSFVPTEAQ